MIESSSEEIGAAGATVLFLLNPILLELDGGRYVGPPLPLPLTLAELVSGRRGGGDGIGGGSSGNGKGVKGEGCGGGSGGGGGSSGGDVGKSGSAVQGGASGGGGRAGSTARVQAHYDAHLTALSLWDGEEFRTILAGTVLPTV